MRQHGGRLLLEGRRPYVETAQDIRLQRPVQRTYTPEIYRTDRRL